jgi:hypothetical protein
MQAQMKDDTEVHMLAIRKANDECFRLFGTDSIHDRHVLWPRWLEQYDKYVKEYYASQR